MDRFAEMLPLQEVTAAVVFVDVVESVRLLQREERRTIDRIRYLLAELARNTVPSFGGSVIERQGDGMLLQFSNPRAAVQCGLALHSQAEKIEKKAKEQSPLALRVGIHADRMLSDSTALYGQAVSLAARVLAAAGAGETVVTNPVRDVLNDDVDARVDDMGMCYLKHWDDAVRLWRVWPAQPMAQTCTGAQRGDVEAPDGRLSMAVLNFEHAGGALPHGVGEFICGALVAGLSHHPRVRLTSPLSAVRVSGNVSLAHNSAAQLRVRYVLSGSMLLLGTRLIVQPQLIDTHRDEIVWADQVMDALDDWIQAWSEPVQRILDATVEALTQAHIQEIWQAPVPQLDSHSLMAGAVTLMHRASGVEMQRSEVMLQAVVDRHRRAAVPRAWLAKWHVLAAVQGQVDQPAQAHIRAIECANRALDAEPGNALALAVKGHAMCHQGLHLDDALVTLNQATLANPNEASAWLYRSVWHHMWGDAATALSDARQALLLSPLDPQRDHLELVLGVAHFVANDLPQAIEAFTSSIRRNQCHLPALRALMAAQWESGHDQQARQTLVRLLAFTPGLTVNSFLSTGAHSLVRQRVAKALTGLGVPPG